MDSSFQEEEKEEKEMQENQEKDLKGCYGFFIGLLTMFFILLIVGVLDSVRLLDPILDKLHVP